MSSPMYHSTELVADLREEREHGQEFVSARYFDLLRNYRRYGWLVLYLFGASPAVCASRGTSTRCQSRPSPVCQSS